MCAGGPVSGRLALRRPDGACWSDARRGPVRYRTALRVGAAQLELGTPRAKFLVISVALGLARKLAVPGGGRAVLVSRYLHTSLQ